MVEEWRAVVEPGYEEHYEVSSLGHVRRTQTKRVLRPGLHPKGYLTVVFSVENTRRSLLVHRLVLMAFVGPCPDGQEARHWDGDRANNVLSNLLWGTSVENEHDKRRHGTESHGSRNGQSKLTDVQVADIRIRSGLGESQRSIARGLGISQAQVSRIVTGKRRGPRSEERGPLSTGDRQPT